MFHVCELGLRTVQQGLGFISTRSRRELPLHMPVGTPDILSSVDRTERQARASRFHHKGLFGYFYVYGTTNTT